MTSPADDAGISEDKKGPGIEHFDWEKEQIVVATAHLGAVGGALREINIPYFQADQSKRLGLTLLTLGTEGGEPTPMSAIVAQSTKPDLGKGDDPLGAVIHAIKASFGSPGNWAPSIGRNRTVGSVNATNGRIAISLGDPEPLPEGTGPARPTFGLPTDPTGRAIRVGIVDTDLCAHDWFEGAWISPVPGVHDRPADVPPGDHRSFRAGHSTAVAGAILAKAPSAQVQVLGVLDANGAATSWTVAKGIVEFCDSGIDILNLSLACYTADGRPPLALETAINRLDRSVVVVAGAGNFGASKKLQNGIDMSKAPAWPAAIPSVLAIGSVDTNKQLSTFSPDAPWVDDYALGERVVAPLVGNLMPGFPGSNEFAYWYGTSFSAANYSGDLAAQAFQLNTTPRALRPW